MFSFADFSLKLPGFSLSVIKYIDEKSHELRYVLKNKHTSDVYFVVLFTLLFGDELKEAEASVKEDTESTEGSTNGFEPQADDVD